MGYNIVNNEKRVRNDFIEVSQFGTISVCAQSPLFELVAVR